MYQIKKSPLQVSKPFTKDSIDLISKLQSSEKINPNFGKTAVVSSAHNPAKDRKNQQADLVSYCLQFTGEH